MVAWIAEKAYKTIQGNKRQPANGFYDLYYWELLFDDSTLYDKTTVWSRTTILAVVLF